MCVDSEALDGDPIALKQLRNVCRHLQYFCSHLLYLIDFFLYLLFSLNLLCNPFCIHCCKTLFKL